MLDSISSVVVFFFGLACYLAVGIVCTFYTRWLQRTIVARYSSQGTSRLMKKIYESRYFIWETRATGIAALIAAAYSLVVLARSLARILFPGR